MNLYGWEYNGFDSGCQGESESGEREKMEAIL
jgi:hypothetical protein